MIDFLARVRICLYRRSIVLLSACAPFRDLCSLLSGGVTIDTHNGNSIAFRTVIQVDGDVLTIVARCDGAEALWEAHAEGVAKVLARMSDQLHGVVRWLTGLAGVATFAVLALCWWPAAPFSRWVLEDWLHLFVINFSIPISVGALAKMPVVRRAIGTALLHAVPWLGLHDYRGRIEAVQAAGND